MIRLTVDSKAARTSLGLLQREDLPRVIGRTLRRVGDATKSQASKDLRSRVNLKKATIDAAITMRRSEEVGTLTAFASGRAWFELRFSGKPFGIRDFDARQTAKGVTYKVGKAGGRKLYARKGSTGFIVRRFGGHVFTRVGPDPRGPAKAPIKKAVGPSIPQFMATRRMQAQLSKFARDYWARELERNVFYAIARRNRK